MQLNKFHAALVTAMLLTLNCIIAPTPLAGQANTAQNKGDTIVLSVYNTNQKFMV